MISGKRNRDKNHSSFINFLVFIKNDEIFSLIQSEIAVFYSKKQQASTIAKEKTTLFHLNYER